MKLLKGQAKGFIIGVVITLLMSTTVFATGSYVLSLLEAKIVLWC